jgi:LPXTG-motif cell wall-anchored protein
MPLIALIAAIVVARILIAILEAVTPLGDLSGWMVAALGVVGALGGAFLLLRRRQHPA